MIRLLPLLALLLFACAPQGRDTLQAGITEPVEDRATPAAPNSTGETTPGNASSTPTAPAPETSALSPRYVRTSVSGISVEAVAFDSRSHRLVVADQPGGPGSRWPDSRAAGKALQGLAAINGGFFTPEGQPLGQVIASGTSAGTNNRSSLGSGFYIDKGGRSALVRRDRFTGGQQALQAGPFLIENNRIVTGLSTKSSSARTFLATDGQYRWIFARTGPCSLAQLAEALNGASIGPVRPKSALNLDGGRSSEIWISKNLSGGPAFTRPLWNKPVRNFLVLLPRD